MEGLKPVFCEFINKGWRVGWSRGEVCLSWGFGTGFKNYFLRGGNTENLF